MLDPNTLIFHFLPTGSLRWGISGYAPAANICVTAVWENAGFFSASCNELDRFSPYVIWHAKTGANCETWAYQGNVNVDNWTGCVEFSANGGMKYVDGVFDVSGPDFTGQIVMDNRSLLSAHPVVFGFEYSAPRDEPFYVRQSSGSDSRSWVSLSQKGVEVTHLERCDLPVCGSTAGQCRSSRPLVAPLPLHDNVQGTGRRGAIYTVWDGTIRKLDAARGCLTREVAMAGTYRAEICYSMSALGGDAGLSLKDPQCLAQEFEYPTAEQVILTADVK